MNSGMDRRRFLKMMAAGAAGMMIPGSVLASGAAGAKPNVIIIFTDDQGAADAGCYGSEDIKTPAIDAIAKRGVRFTQFYAAAPVCSPSRASLLTGRYPERAGVPDNIGSDMGTPGMPGGQATIAEMLKRAGYATAHIGKWHLGSSPECLPNAQGFDYSFGHLVGCIDNYSHFFYWHGPNRHDLWRNGEEVFHDGAFFGDLMVDEAGRFMEKNRERPFFLYFAVNMPHYPYQGDVKWREKYDDVEYPRNLYGAFLSTMDERIGRLMAKLDSLGLRENTIVIFQSDQGHTTEVRGHRGGGSAGRYRGAKKSLFEGGIRMPAIISMPGTLPQGEVRTQMSHGCDWLPTIAELCGVELLEKDIDGRSLAPVIKSADAPPVHDVLHWTYQNSWAIRKGNWKLLGDPVDTSNKGELTEDDKFFLVNLAQDTTEMTNIADKHPKIVERLKEMHQKWAMKAAPTNFLLQRVK